jgi:signal transduction histidine kinase
MLPALTTGRRLSVGLFAIILVFLGAAMLVSLQMRELRSAAEEMKVLSEGIQASLTLGNFIREQYVHQAHVIITRDTEHAHHVASARDHTAQWTTRMRQLLANDEETRLLAALDRTVEEFNGVFAQIVPLVARGESERVHELHTTCEKLVTRATDQIDRIVDRFARRIDVARARIDAQGARAVRVGYASAGVAVLLAVLLAGFLTRSITRPIAILMEGTREVAGGNLRKTLAIGRDDEFGRLADAFNRMTAKLATREREIIESEKLTTLGRLAAGVAHELNNPLGIILGYLKTMLRDADPKEGLTADLKIIQDEAQQCRRIVADLLAMARPAEIDVRTVDLERLLAECVERLMRQEAFANVQIEVDCEPGLALVADPEKLKQVLNNLAVNAADAMPGGGRLSLKGRRVAVVPARLMESGWAGSGAIELAVADTGSGIPKDKLDQVFQPFFTTKTNGTGLGLFICHHIVRAHAGSIELKSARGRGTTITIWLPASDAGD